jgi:hypothetical protein
MTSLPGRSYMGLRHPRRDTLNPTTKALAATNRAIELAPNDAFVRGLTARAAWMACQPDLVRIETSG